MRTFFRQTFAILSMDLFWPGSTKDRPLSISVLPHEEGVGGHGNGKGPEDIATIENCRPLRSVFPSHGSSSMDNAHAIPSVGHGCGVVEHQSTKRNRYRHDHVVQKTTTDLGPSDLELMWLLCISLVLLIDF